MHKKNKISFLFLTTLVVSSIFAQNSVVTINGDNLNFDNVIDVARNNAKVELSQDAKNRIFKTRQYVEDLVNQEKVVYGLTTGFGFLGNVSINKDQATDLQSNLIRSHSAGVGSPLSQEIVRAAILLRINTFAKGFSGIRLSTVEKLIELLNKNIYPYVPEKGSVGASGDLVPLSHIALVLIGEGEVFLNGKRYDTADVLKELNFEPISLTSKEGLALNNGTPVLTAIAALSLYDAKKLVKNAQITAAASMEALRARTSPFNPKLHFARPHDGQIKCAENIRRLIDGSNLVNSNTKKVQDAYSIRCFPQVMGASMDAVNYVEKILLTEMNSATDNPLIFEEGAVSGGNFHGQPIALAMDFFAIAVSEIADISERRVARIVDPNLNDNLPAFLVNSSGLNSGFMIPQYTAAALVSENKILAHPASVDSIPTCANQEDHVSMGSIASRKALSVLNNTYSVIAIELYNAIQALDFRENKPGKAISIVKDLVREKVEFVSDDRIMYKDMAIIEQMLRDGEIIKAVEKEIGEINA
ncbi:histidine ammonia-lyase [Candidatus Dependentiae bacterium]|nr:histidine ammonia-lyase [Candidatus Dependentiae bacterium]MBU4387492.1 histidine ammonia-lyase [Candidatus Dependentiae bacterium]MCG2756041.1 histidine ammonia-lyase [Candidatus Dependentiae bacterium]